MPSRAYVDERDRKFRAVVDDLPVAICRWKPDTTLTYVNKEYVKWITGGSDVIGRRWIDFVPAEVRSEVDAFYRDLAAHPRTVSYEHEIIVCDGSRRWFSRTDVPWFNEGGMLLGFQSMGLDVTERKREHEASQKQADRLQRYFDVSPIIMYTLTVKNGKVRTVWVSENIRRILGYSSEEALQPDWWIDRIHPEDRKQTLAVQSRIFAERQLVHRYRVLHRDGSVLWLRDDLRFVHADDGGEGNIIGAWTDITDFKRTQDAMHLQSMALIAAANAIVITDKDGFIEWVNPAFTAATGYTADESIGRNPREFLKSGVHDRAFYRELWDTILSGRVWRGEMVNLRKDGTLVSEEQTITPVKDARGEITHFVDIRQDVTERKQLEHQFLQAQKMEVVGRLAGGVAHDFNNQLSVIIGHAQIVETTLEGSSPLRNHIQEIINAGRRSANLTRQLLTFARKQTIAPRVIDLNNTVAGLLQMLERLMGENVELIWKPGEDLWPVRLDPTQIDQILANLAVNARDAISDVGKVTIRTENTVLDDPRCRCRAELVPGPYVMLAISDDGCGMTSEIQEKLFEPFFTTKPLGKGTGLGLPTVYGIVKQNGGLIDVQSEPGAGSVFSIYLPPYEGKMPAASGDSRPPLAVSGTETVLLVEDDPSLLLLSRKLLESLGYSVRVAGSPLEAIERVKANREDIDLLITDVIMPEMNGRDLWRELAALRPGIKCLFMSGYTADVIGPHGVLEGNVTFLQKPFTIGALAEKIREALSRPDQD